MKWPWQKPKAPPTVHDYSNRYWGHDFVFMGADADKKIISLTGWGSGLRNGDYFKYETYDHRIVTYRIKEVDYYRDPRDMWKAQLVKVEGNE